MDRTITVLTIGEAANELGYGSNVTDPDLIAIINQKIRSVDSYIMAAVGNDYDQADPKSKELAFLILRMLYDPNGFTELEYRVVSTLKSNLILQLKLDLDEAHENAEMGATQ